MRTATKKMTWLDCPCHCEGVRRSNNTTTIKKRRSDSFEPQRRNCAIAQHKEIKLLFVYMNTSNDLILSLEVF